MIYEIVVQQSFEPICGAMSIAFAFSCVLGHIPTNISYDIKSFRNHLRTCISSRQLRPFPELDANTNDESVNDTYFMKSVCTEQIYSSEQNYINPQKANELNICAPHIPSGYKIPKVCTTLQV